MDEEKREVEVVLVAGVHADDTKVRYWKWKGSEWDAPRAGDYAIVQCLNDFELVKVLGSIKTRNKYVDKLTNGHKLKSVVKKLWRHEVRND